jgi:quercetin dioxygenase-like cupin family protein
LDKREQIAANGGVSERTPRPLQGPTLRFDLAAEAAALKKEDAWRVNGHNARTLIKYADFRVVLIALKMGAHVAEHQTDQQATVHALSGELRLRLPQQTIDLAAGDLLALDRAVAHDIEALEDSLFLLSIGWSKRD